jgi:hypothetical protein
MQTSGDDKATSSLKGLEMTREALRRLLRKKGPSMYSQDQWIYQGECYHCLATCYRNDSEEATRWERGDPSCLHELQNSVNRINRDGEEED